ncbi:unnamed protein product [Malus baccata var. baccata]
MGSVSHPPHFDGDNYAAWKAKMKLFLWAQDDKVWLAVEEESKLQHLVTKFENITMSDDESFSDFYAKLSLIVNGCHNLGDSIPEHRIVKKILRSLPMRFHAKRTSIEESKDLNTYKLEQLIGSLQTYKLEFPDSKKMKSIALKAVKEEESDGSIEDLSEDELVELTMQIRRTSEHRSSNNRVQCHECQGYGQIASECANTIKRKEKKNKAMMVTWSDSDSGDASMSESEKDTFAFIGTVDGYDTECSFVEEPDLEEVLRKYSDLYDINVQVKKDNSNLKKKLAFVESEKKEAEVKHQSLEDEVVEMRRKVQELSIGSGKIDKMLSYGKSFGDKGGLGFESTKTTSSSSVTRFVKASDIPSLKVGDDKYLGFTPETSTIFAHVSNPVKTSINLNKPKQSRKFIPICHLCGIPGHIRPKCNKLRKKNSSQEKVSRNFEKENLKEQFVTYLKEINRIARIISVPRDEEAEREEEVAEGANEEEG